MLAGIWAKFWKMNLWNVKQVVSNLFDMQFNSLK